MEAYKLHNLLQFLAKSLDLGNLSYRCLKVCNIILKYLKPEVQRGILIYTF